MKWRADSSAPPWVHVSCTRLLHTSCIPRLPHSENRQRWERAISAVNEVGSHTPDLFVQLSPARYILHSYIMQHDCRYCTRPPGTTSHWVLFRTFFKSLIAIHFHPGLCVLYNAWLTLAVSRSAARQCNRKDIVLHITILKLGSKKTVLRSVER